MRVVSVPAKAENSTAFRIDLWFEHENSSNIMARPPFAITDFKILYYSTFNNENRTIIANRTIKRIKNKHERYDLGYTC